MTSGWPYHMDPHRRMVKCASNPCTRHPAGEDVIASSPEEAYKIMMDRDGSADPGMHSRKQGQGRDAAAEASRMIGEADYDSAAADGSPLESFNAASFIRDNVDENGMLPSSWPDHETFVRQMRQRNLLDTKKLSDEEQNDMLAVAENKKYMDNALKADDGFPNGIYDSMPAATEMLNDLAANETTSAESLGRIVDIAVARRSNPNFRRQVYVSNIANHRNLGSEDAKRLYNAYPEDCVRAQRFDKTIINDVLRDPTAPDNVRAIAITNPNATVDAMEAAIRDGGDVYRAQAMLNPNGRYLNVARKMRRKAIRDREEMADFDDEQKALERFRAHLRERVGSAS